MGLIFNDVAGELPLVRRVRSATCDATIGFSSAVKASSMIRFARSGDGATVHVKGPETAGTLMTCPDGWEFFGVALRLSAYLRLFSPSSLTDSKDALLPTLAGDRILLDNRIWEMPTAQNVDVFVDRLVRAGLLVFDPLVDEIRQGERPRDMSERIAQLRFRRAVGPRPDSAAKALIGQPVELVSASNPGDDVEPFVERIAIASGGLSRNT